MAISNYTDLQAAIADWLNRDDLVAVIPSFIALAEADISRRLSHWRMETRAITTISGRYTALPTDWNQTVSLTVTSTGVPYTLHLASDADMNDRRMLNSDTTGRPKYYAVTGGQIEVFPTPDTSYTASLVYLANVPALSASQTTNWLLSLAPDLYLYGALTQSAPYLKDDQRAAIWAGMYQSALDGLNAASDQQQFSGTGMRLRTRGM